MKVAIVKLSALGDIIHAMVVMQFIKKCNHSIIVFPNDIPMNNEVIKLIAALKVTNLKSPAPGKSYAVSKYVNK